MLFLPLLILLPSLFVDAQVSFTTVPPHSEGEDVIIVSEDNSTVDVYCIVYDDESLLSVTDWTILYNGSSQDVTFAASEEVSIKYSFVKRALSTLIVYSNLSFHLTQETSQTKLSCTHSGKSVTFFIGIPDLPEVENSVINITEGSLFNVSLAGSDNSPFPPPQGVWSFNDGPINDTAISLNIYSIEVASVNREQSGIYTLTLTNVAGISTANLTLNVQYKPEGVIGDTVVYTNIGDTVVLTAFTMFVGNPVPYQVWISPNNDTITHSNDSIKYSISFTDTIQLTIHDVSITDAGQWIFGASNSVGSISTNIDLVIADPPGPPTNLSSHIDSSIVTILWVAPIDAGTPPITNYILKLTPSPPLDVILKTSNNDTRFELVGLVPNTQYNLTIRGQSTVFPPGEQSDILTFKTLPGAPDILNATARSGDGGIIVDWIFRHIGGVDKDEFDITVQCRPVFEDDFESSGSGLALGELSASCNGEDDQCIDNNFIGGIKVGPVEAGEVYTCGMIAFSNAYTDALNLSSLMALTGIPSVPIGNDMCNGSDLIIMLASKWAGVTSGGHVTFSAFTSDGTINKTFTYMGYVNSQNVTVNLGTIYNKTTIYITASNIYGTSPVQTFDIQRTCSIAVTPTVSTTSTPTETSSSTSPVIIIISVIVAIIILVTITTTIVIIVIYIVKKKKTTGKMKIGVV